MEILEKDLEDLFFNDLLSGGFILSKRGFKSSLSGLEDMPNKITWVRQPTISSYGRADIVGFTRNRGSIMIEVIELKIQALTCDDIEQVFRYASGIKSIIQRSFKHPIYPEIRCCLIGPDVKSGHYIHNHTALSLYTYEYSLDGISFQYHQPFWVRTDASKTKITDLNSFGDFGHYYPITNLNMEVSNGNL